MVAEASSKVSRRTKIGMLRLFKAELKNGFRGQVEYTRRGQACIWYRELLFGKRLCESYTDFLFFALNRSHKPDNQWK